ncbi:hypothetical protein VP06_14810 [Methylobacterium aquaticum]|uniref:Uncharacterized protein n=2 Tax=Methylobacterium aquaticum TaxID=270351 RepID=A0A0J6SL34_9HYPH|nr:hypothetical protein VP06_14810 [Methylobacterium aquaticum]
MPKAGGKTNARDELHSFGFGGSQARPMQPIPVLNGRMKFAPDYGAPTYSEFNGDAMTDYALYALTCGRMRLEQILIGDTPIWDDQNGFAPEWSGIEMQFVEPGEQVTLYPVNVVTADELNGVQLSQDFTPGYIVNAAGTSAKELLLDFVWSGGAYVTYKDRTLAANTDIAVEARTVNAAGAATGPWIQIFRNVYSQNKQSQIRVTEHVTVAPGRYEVRARRQNPSVEDSGIAKISGTDEVTWTALRAHIDGPNTFPRVTMLALKGVASQKLSGVSGGGVKVIGTRILPVWRDGQFVEEPTRSIAWAALDWWRNGDYAAGLSLSNVDFAAFLAYDRLWGDLGHTFDYRFTEVQNLDDVLETVLRAGRAIPSPVGDKLTITRDQPRGLPRMLFTDNDIVRDSLEIDYALSDESWADGMVGEYVDETTWRLAEVSSAPDGVTLLKPARVQLDGIVQRTQAAGAIRQMAAESQYRRITVSWIARMEGRLLKRGDLVKITTEEPESWGSSHEVVASANNGFSLTLDPAPDWTTSGTHWIEIRQRDGRPFGPVRVTRGATDADLTINGSDAASIAAAASAQYGYPVSLADAVARSDSEEPPWVAFSPGEPRSFPVLITSGDPDQDGEHIHLSGVLDAPEVYQTTETGVPPLLQVPDLYSGAMPVITFLTASISQRQATLVLTAGWLPAKNAATYDVAVSYDGGATWAAGPPTDRTTYEAVVGASDTMKFRVRGVTPGGVPGGWSVTDVIAPELQIQGDLFADLSIQIEKLSAETQREIRSIADLGRGTLAYGADQTQTALRTADDTIRGAIRQLTEAVDRLANEAATTNLGAYEQRELIKVGASANFAAIEREEVARVSQNEALASIQTTLAARLTLAEGDIVGNATAIQGISTRVTNAEGVLTAQSQQITTLGSRIDATDLQLSGVATAQQSLTTRVSLTEGNISTLSQDLTALRSTVTAQGGQIAGQATALDSLTTEVNQNSSDIAAQAQRTTALESTVSTQGGQITGNSQALQQLTTRTETVEGGLRSQSEQLTNLSSAVTGQGGQIGANAQAVSQLQTRASNIEGQQSAQASSLQALSTTVGSHTATLTTYGTSINGIRLEYGIAFEIDGQTGGLVMTGAKRLDGSGLEVLLKLSGDLFVDGMITSRMVSTTSLITTSAQIGTLTVDSINVRDGAISGLVSAQSGGQQASVTINVRTAGAVLVIANRTGDLSQRFTQVGTNTGALNVYRDGNLIGAIPANFTMDFDPNPQINASYFRLGPTAYPILDVPGVGSHTYMVVDDNSRGIGGVFICVQESK